MNKSISFFAPAYNEQDNIEEFIVKSYEILRKRFDDFEIIIINDGSTDRTQDKLNDLSIRYAQLSVVTHNKNLGYGEAIKSGFKAAEKDLIFFTDSDLQFDLTEIENFIKEVGEFSAVVGYRKTRSDNFIRTINAKSWSILMKMVLGLRVKDIDCAFKLFKREALSDIQLKSSGALVSAELLTKIKNNGVKVKELPVSHYPRKKGKQTGASFSVIFKAFKELVKLRKEIV